jgi:XapX domain-containing protein
MKEIKEKRKKTVIEMLICLAVGLVIGVIFSLFKLPLPVPHGWGGVLGLIGMFLGGQIAAILIHRV